MNDDDSHIPPDAIKRMKAMAEDVGSVLETMRLVKGKAHTDMTVQMARAGQMMGLLADLRDHAFSHCPDPTPSCLEAEFKLFASVLADTFSSAVAQYAEALVLSGEQLDVCTRDADVLFKKTKAIKF